MSSLFAIHSSAPPSDGSSRTVNKLIIASVLILALAACAILAVWVHFSAKYGAVNHSLDSIQTKLVPTEGGTKTPGGPAFLHFQTIYENSQGQVTLEVPGLWTEVRNAPIPKPDKDHRFCVLSAKELSLMFWVQYPDLMPSLEGDLAAIKSQRMNQMELESASDLSIKGRPAKHLRYRTQGMKGRLDMLLVRDWPGLYVLAVFGNRNAEQAWQTFEQGLSQTIEIR